MTQHQTAQEHPTASADQSSTVAALRRYPVKSMLGEDLDDCPTSDRGLLGDRAYAVIDETDGKVASAKNPRKWRSLLDFQARFVAPPVDGEALPAVAITCPDGTVVRSDTAGVDAALSEALGRRVRLAPVAPEHSALEEVWPNIEGLAPSEFIEQTKIGTDDSGEAISEIQLGFASPPGTFFDLSVLHLLTTATLRHLAALAPAATFDARRYRPNLVVATDEEGFVENAWVGKRLRIGPRLEVAVTLATMRCVMTTLAQADLPLDRSTLQAIAAHNRIEIPGFGTWACAGIYGDITRSGVVSVGDPVEVTAD